MSLLSLPEGYRALVVGASGGIGAAFVEALVADPRSAIVHASSRRPLAHASPKVRPYRIDLEDEATIAAHLGVAERSRPHEETR